MSDIEKIVQGFPHRPITPIMGYPTYITIKEVNISLSADVTSIHSYRGNELLWHLVLIMAPATFAIITEVRFSPPCNPDATLTIPIGFTESVMVNLKLAFKRSRDYYAVYIGTDVALIKQLLGAVDATYYHGLCSRYTSYAGVSISV